MQILTRIKIWEIGVAVAQSAVNRWVTDSNSVSPATDSWKDNRRFRCKVVRSIDMDIMVSHYNNNHLEEDMRWDLVGGVSTVV